MFTFLDFIVHKQLSIVPIVAVDFSLANLTFDDRKCIHTLKKGVQNDYIDALHSVYRAYRHFSPFFCGYGFGGRLTGKHGKTSDCFAMNGDYFDPTLHSEDDLMDAYGHTLKNC
jgi:hypothetical protein